MTPRTSLFVALIGLLIVVSCAIPLYFVGNRGAASDNADMGIVLLALSGILGLSVLVVGLIMAAATTLRGKRRQTSATVVTASRFLGMPQSEFLQRNKEGASQCTPPQDCDNGFSSMRRGNSRPQSGHVTHSGATAPTVEGNGR